MSDARESIDLRWRTVYNQTTMGMMKVMRVFLRIFLLLIPCLILLTVSCIAPGDSVSPQMSFEPSSPVSVDLSISHLPLLNDTAELVCTVSSRYSAPDSNAQIILPDGVSLVSGDTQWQGNITENNPVSFSAQVLFKQTGHQVIEAAARCIIDNENTWGDMDAIYLDIGNESSTFGWNPEPVRATRIDKWAVIKTDLEISHAPRVNEPAKLFITTVSPVDFSDLSIGILINSRDAEISDGESGLTAVNLVPGADQCAMQITNVNLQAGIPYHFSAIAIFKKTGYHSITASANQKVDGVSYTGTQDTIYLKIGTRTSSFEKQPSKETPPNKLPPPPSINP